MRRTDPLIIGGGPAGTATAILLARGGAKPLILEASREQGDALCGGFVSWRTLESVRALGVDLDDLGGNPARRVRLFSGSMQAEAPLPARAIGISRRRFDSVLLAQAERIGAVVERGVPVRSLEADGSILLKDGASMAADALFIATGKHDLRGLGRARREAPTLGLRIRLAPHPALTQLIGDAIELHLFDGGYAGLILQEDGSANLCMAVRKEALSEARGNGAGASKAGGTPLGLLLSLAETHPALAERLAYMQSAPQIDAIAAVPYGWIGRNTIIGQFRVGDQAACIPSLAGEGNGLALASGMMAAQRWLSGGGRAAPSFQRDFAARAFRPVSAAKFLWHWAENPRLAPWMLRATNAVPALTGLAAALTRINR
jgi:menaquinone-9 beta-reductase